MFFNRIRSLVLKPFLKENIKNKIKYHYFDDSMASVSSIIKCSSKI